MDISIITLNYKKPQLTLSCIHSLYKEYKAEFEDNAMEVLIVDNYSQDNSITLLEQEIKEKNYKNIHVIANSENAGFGKGCNLGAKNARGKYLLFLNNDTEVKDRGILKMASFMDSHNDVAILGGQLRNPDGSLQASSGSFYTLSKVILLLLGMQRYGLLDKSPKSISKVDWVKGGLLLIRKKIFEELDGFDEKIFMYTEDMELCYRASLSGHQTYFYPDIHIIHAEHGSTNKTFAIVNIYKNLLYFYSKHRSKFEKILVKSMLTTKAVLLIIAGTLLQKPYLRNTYSEALRAI